MVISIHALCEEGDPSRPYETNRKIRFLSTPSARRATERYAVQRQYVYISIHALCEEGDPASVGFTVVVFRFLSTPSARRATTGGAGRKPSKNISIHALCEEGDQYSGSRRPSLKISFHALCEEGDASCRDSAVRCFDFYPRPLRGGRRYLVPPRASFSNFYPRPLRGGRPDCRRLQLPCEEISIHALCEEGDYTAQG